MRHQTLSALAAALLLAGCSAAADNPPTDGADGSAVDGSASAGGASSPAAPGPSRPSTGGATDGSDASSGTPGGPTTPTQDRSSFTVVMTGDVLLHHQVWEQAETDARREGRKGFDFDPMFAGQKKLVSGADLAICHQETPVSDPDGPYTSYPSFSVPPQVLQGIKGAGYDVCTTGSNHSLDHGFTGLKRTLDDMDALGIKHVGTARTAKESRTPLIMDVKGVNVALLEYAYGTNGIPVPADEPWSVHLIDKAKILADAHRARADGADVVILALHWGLEYHHDPTPEQAELGPALLESPDIDLIYGHHAHVVQPFQKIDGEWIAYGLGNGVSGQARLSRLDVRDGVLARFTFSPKEGGGWHVSKAEYAPSYVGNSPIHIIDLGTALNSASTPASLRSVYAASWKRTSDVVNDLGAKKAGLRPIDPPPAR